MGRKRKTKYDALFAKMILDVNEDDLNINFSKICKEEKFSKSIQQQMRSFFKRKKFEFNIFINIELKNEESQVLLDNYLSEIGYKNNEPLGDFIRRKEIKEWLETPTIETKIKKLKTLSEHLEEDK